MLSIGPLPSGLDGLALPNTPEQYARHLYAALRMLDQEGADRILIESPPELAAWIAVQDRLQRAASARDPEFDGS
ncbi:Sua5 family C-terminal domain-containing protein [Ahniella affigens]|uniref:Sua5 family C-terminal domain-containing protein n=1 Tax=Ahniella affigens TaxID=2021234 RepID=UPI003CCDDD4A